MALISSEALGAAATLVYRRVGGVWSQELSLPFATAFAISRDGTTILLGMPSFSGAGEARIYVRSGMTWAQQGPALSVGDGLSEFGKTVALSGDGNTAVVATAGDGTPSTTPFHSGTVWTFTRSGTTWSRQSEKLFVPGIGRFGESLALSGDASAGWSSPATMPSRVATGPGYTSAPAQAGAARHGLRRPMATPTSAAGRRSPLTGSGC